MARSGRNTIPKYVEDNFAVEEEIAKGKFGVVYKCQEKSTGSDVAVKVMLRRHNKKEDVDREVAILKQVDHPRLLTFASFKEDGGNFILVTELLTGGELFDYCTSKEYLLEGETIYFLKQILDGVNYLHSKKICHLDLKPENIVLKDETSKDIKIIDFGTARDLGLSSDLKVMVGTPEFIAPEVLNYDPVSCNSDMWAIGVITFCLLTGCSPFLGDNDGETIQNVTLGEFDYPEADEGYDDISDAAKDFITRLLNLSSKDRMSANESLKHKWIAALSYRQSRISTDRLKKLRRRRKLLAAIQAVRLSVGLYRAFSRSSSISKPTRAPSLGETHHNTLSTTDEKQTDPVDLSTDQPSSFSLPKRLSGPLCANGFN